MNNNQKMYRAIDNQTVPARFLHLSGTKLTDTKTNSWLGTMSQFERICEMYEWDNLKPVPAKLFE